MAAPTHASLIIHTPLVQVDARWTNGLCLTPTSIATARTVSDISAKVVQPVSYSFFVMSNFETIFMPQ